MGDLIGFEGFLNVSAPFRWDEHNAVWKSDRRYHDFKFGNSINNSCQYPPMYSEKGIFLGNITDDLHTCRESDFDQVSFSSSLPSQKMITFAVW
jgi:alpha-1,3-glucan synthase